MAQAKLQKSEQQQIYHHILDTQLKLKSDMYSHYGTMTDQERRLNKHDLSVPHLIRTPHVVIQGMRKRTCRIDPRP